jgi:hypothetical protein
MTPEWEERIQRGLCPWCDRKREGNAGDYYHEKGCEAAYLVEALKVCEDPEERARLEARLEMARYVGD